MSDYKESPYYVSDEDLLTKLRADEIEPEEFGSYESWAHMHYVADVLRALSDLHYADGLPYPIGYTWVGAIEDAIEGISIEAYMGDVFYLSKYVELKHTTDDREAKGVAQALAIRDAVLYEHHQLVEYATQHSLPGRRTA